LSEIDCDDVLREIELYIDGELGQERSRLLAAHLSTCSPCGYRAEFQARLREIVRAKCHSDTPQTLMWRIREAIRSESTPKEE